MGFPRNTVVFVVLAEKCTFGSLPVVLGPVASMPIASGSVDWRVRPGGENRSACNSTSSFLAVVFIPSKKRSYSPIAGDPSASPTSRIQSAWLMQVWVHGELTFVSGALRLVNHLIRPRGIDKRDTAIRKKLECQVLIIIEKTRK